MKYIMISKLFSYFILQVEQLKLSSVSMMRKVKCFLGNNFSKKDTIGAGGSLGFQSQV